MRYLERGLGPIVVPLIVALMSACRENASESVRQPVTRESPGVIATAPAREPRRLGSIGRTATRSEIQAWDIDVNAAGKGLPAGRGTHAEGATLYASKCAVCHGLRGEGLATFPKLIGAEPRADFPFGRDARYVKTIGNYWPYATTLYDYVRRAMPLTAPGSLSNNEVYSLVAFLLAENQVIDRSQVVDAEAVRRVHMPARSHFVVDDRKGGPTFR